MVIRKNIGVCGLAILFLLCACNGADSDKEFVGSWQGTFRSSLAKVPPDVTAFGLEIKQDHTFSLSSFAGVMSGQWSVEDTSFKLDVRSYEDGYGKSVPLDPVKNPKEVVLAIAEDDLVWSLSNGRGDVVFKKRE